MPYLIFSGSPAGSMRIAGNYTGVAGSRLLVKSTWNNPDVQQNDRLLIDGNASGNTRVEVPGGIIGDVSLTQNELIKNGNWLSPVATVAGNDNGSNNGLTFTGTANTTNAGQAQLLKHENSYYWTLGACPAGTVQQGEGVVSNGGRVLCVTALGDNLRQAQQNAYAAVAKINFDGMQYRKDIGYRALK